MVNFDESTHTYTDENGKKLISVTTLLRDAGISPSYDFVNEQVLKAAADRGTLIHKEIEDYIKKGEIGFTRELQEFIRYVEDNNLTVLASEKQVNNDNVAGTIDLIVRTNTGRIIYVDLKTTSTIHTQAVSWQLSIYKDLDLNNDYENHQDYEDAFLQVWHFDKDGNLTVKEVLEVCKERLQDLYDSYINGSQFVVKVEDNDLAELYEVEKIIAYFENEKKKAEENAKLIRDKIVASMKEQGVTKFENDKIIISYIAPSTKETLDSAALKRDRPDIYSQYKKVSNVKESVRIKLKENSNE